MKLAVSLPTQILLLAFFVGGCTESSKGPVLPEQHTQTQTTNVMVCAPGSFTSGNECIPVKAAECPFGTTLREGQCVPDQAVAVAVAAEEPKPLPAAQPTTFSSEYDALLDTRKSYQAPRTRQLLITEIQGLEALFAAVPKDAPDRPPLLRRLAEGYVELAAAAARDRAQTRDVEAVAKSEKLERAAHAAAIKDYTMLVDRYPSFCRSKSSTAPTGCADEPLYYLGLEYLRTGQAESARKTFLKLIQAWPSSDKIGPAYFLFGETLRAEAATDPNRWPLAEQMFTRTAQIAGPLQTPALLRLAEAYEKQGKTAEAAATRKKAKAAPIAAPGNSP